MRKYRARKQTTLEFIAERRAWYQSLPDEEKQKLIEEDFKTAYAEAMKPKEPEKDYQRDVRRKEYMRKYNANYKTSKKKPVLSDGDTGRFSEGGE